MSGGRHAADGCLEKFVAGVQYVYIKLFQLNQLRLVVDTLQVPAERRSEGWVTGKVAYSWVLMGV